MFRAFFKMLYDLWSHKSASGSTLQDFSVHLLTIRGFRDMHGAGDRQEPWRLEMGNSPWYLHGCGFFSMMAWGPYNSKPILSKQDRFSMIRYGRMAWISMLYRGSGIHEKIQVSKRLQSLFSWTHCHFREWTETIYMITFYQITSQKEGSYRARGRIGIWEMYLADKYAYHLLH